VVAWAPLAWGYSTLRCSYGLLF